MVFLIVVNSTAKNNRIPIDKCHRIYHVQADHPYGPGYHVQSDPTIRTVQDIMCRPTIRTVRNIMCRPTIRTVRDIKNIQT